MQVFYGIMSVYKDSLILLMSGFVFAQLDIDFISSFYFFGNIKNKKFFYGEKFEFIDMQSCYKESA